MPLRARDIPVASYMHARVARTPVVYERPCTLYVCTRDAIDRTRRAAKSHTHPAPSPPRPARARRRLIAEFAVVRTLYLGLEPDNLSPYIIVREEELPPQPSGLPGEDVV